MRTIKELYDLSGQVAVITGGSTGIGKQMSYALGEAGASLIIAARNIERCSKVAKQIEGKLGIKAISARVDVGDHKEVKALFDFIIEKYGKVDILVNNSGTAWGAPSLEYPIEGWNKVININLTGSWLMAQAAAKIMSRRKYGRIINIASAMALVGASVEVMDAVAYQASKAGVVGLTKDLAVKWADYNITVNCIAPGWFPSNMTKETLLKNKELLLQKIPLKRFGGDDELKAAVLYLASAGAGYCTGSILCVDGGWTAQ